MTNKITGEYLDSEQQIRKPSNRAAPANKELAGDASRPGADKIKLGFLRSSRVEVSW